MPIIAASYYPMVHGLQLELAAYVHQCWESTLFALWASLLVSLVRSSRHAKPSDLHVLVSLPPQQEKPDPQVNRHLMNWCGRTHWKSLSLLLWYIFQVLTVIIRSSYVINQSHVCILLFIPGSYLRMVHCSITQKLTTSYSLNGYSFSHQANI